MVSIPYALSVSHFINTVGADAGFAAIIGLALLVLLFFAQMRETSHLRDQVADATDHVSHLEHQLAQLSRSGAAPGPGVAPRPASVPAAGTAPAMAAAAPVASRGVAPAPPRSPLTAPIAPAGVGAPALASATRLIPAFDDGPISVRQTGAAALTGAAGTGAATGAVASAQGPGRPAGVVADPPGPPPATPAGGANGAATGRATPPPAAAGAPRTGQPGRPPTPRNGGRTAAAPAPRRPDAGPESRSRLRGLLGALIALGVVAAIVVVLLLLTGGSSSPTANSSGTSKASNTPTTHRRSHRTVAIKPSAVTVAVLNGTSTNNLAHDVSVKLAAATYKLGKIATATDQTHSSTVVAYLPGHRAAALIVAKSLGLGAGVVSPADQSSQAVACTQGAPCSAQVIITVGADLTSVASSSTAPAATPGTGTAPAGATSTG